MDSQTLTRENVFLLVREAVLLRDNPARLRQAKKNPEKYVAERPRLPVEVRGALLHLITTVGDAAETANIQSLTLPRFWVGVL